MNIYSEQMLVDALEDNRASAVAREWGVTRQFVHKLMKRYGITDGYRVECVCDRCSHKWLAVKIKLSTVCPKCKTKEWV